MRFFIIKILFLLSPIGLLAQNGGNLHTKSEALKLLSFDSISNGQEQFRERAGLKNSQFIPNIGKQIESARIERSISIDDLANNLDISKQQLIKVESGKVALTRRMISKVEKQLQCEIIIDGAG